MNTDDLNKYSIISGKTKNYLPSDIVYVDTILTEDLSNVILVYCYFGIMKNRFFDKIEFYEKLSCEEFNKIDKSPLVYILKSSIEDSEEIISDLKKGSAYIEK